MLFFSGLLAMSLWCQCQGKKGQLFELTEIHSSEWQPQDTPHGDFMACSYYCILASPDCLMFMWENGTCKHGLPLFNQENTGPKITLYSRAIVPNSNSPRRTDMFHEKQYIFKDKLYWKSKVKVHSELAEDECHYYGGTLIVLQDKDVWDFARGSNLIDKVSPYFFVGLKPNQPNTTCLAKECDGELIWDDGRPFSQESHFCTIFNDPLSSFGVHLYLGKVPCEGFGDPPSWGVSDVKKNMTFLFICQFNI